MFGKWNTRSSATRWNIHSAAIDRLVHHAVVIEFDVPSYRTDSVPPEISTRTRSPGTCFGSVAAESSPPVDLVNDRPVPHRPLRCSHLRKT